MGLYQTLGKVVLAASLAVSATVVSAQQNRSLAYRPLENPLGLAQTLFPGTVPRQDRSVHSRIRLTTPGIEDPRAPLLYFDDHVAATFTQPDHPEMLVILGYYDPSGKTQTVDCRFAIFPATLNLYDQQLCFGGEPVMQRRDPKDTLFCGQIVAIDDVIDSSGRPDGTKEAILRRYVLDKRTDLLNPTFLEETYRVRFANGKPEQIGGIEREVSKAKPGNVPVYLEYSGVDTTRSVRNYGPVDERPLTQREKIEQFNRAIVDLLNSGSVWDDNQPGVLKLSYGIDVQNFDAMVNRCLALAGDLPVKGVISDELSEDGKHRYVTFEILTEIPAQTERATPTP